VSTIFSNVDICKYSINGQIDLNSFDSESTYGLDRDNEMNEPNADHTLVFSYYEDNSPSSSTTSTSSIDVNEMVIISKLRQTRILQIFQTKTVTKTLLIFQRKSREREKTKKLRGDYELVKRRRTTNYQ